jgi:hypothetical protein
MCWQLLVALLGEERMKKLASFVLFVAMTVVALCGVCFADDGTIPATATPTIQGVPAGSLSIIPVIPPDPFKPYGPPPPPKPK